MRVLPKNPLELQWHSVTKSRRALVDVWSVASAGYRRLRRTIMAWNTPKVTEIPLGAEINSYVCGEKK